MYGIEMLMMPNAIRSSKVVVKAVGNETLLYDAEGSAIHVLNATARFIWDQCNGEQSAEEIAHSLREQFAVPPDRDVMQDVQRVLTELEQKGVICYSNN